MIINNLFYELEMVAHDVDVYSDGSVEFDLSIVMNIKGKVVTIPVSEMEKVISLRPVVEDFYRAVADDVIEDAIKQTEKESISIALELK